MTLVIKLDSDDKKRGCYIQLKNDSLISVLQVCSKHISTGITWYTQHDAKMNTQDSVFPMS